MAEFDLIDQIKSICGSRQSETTLGIGDDAALVTPPPHQDVVVCVDTLVEGVHYPPETSAADIGYKSLAVNLSDIAAMGAVPKWATLALTLASYDESWVKEFATGFAQAAQPWDVELIGGDTTRGSQVISVQVLGLVPAGTGVLRSGAQPGDAIMVTGTLGDAALALRLLKQGADCSSFLCSRLNRPTPRVDVGVQLRGIASAMIDVSDGLLQDLSHILTASGVGGRVWADRLPASAAFEATHPSDVSYLQLTGGDDYELCLTVPQQFVTQAQALLDEDGCGGKVVGEIVSGSGLSLLDAKGSAVEMPRSGYQHF